MALGIALVLVLLTVISVYLFWAHVWWFPTNIVTHGAAIGRQFNLTLIICGIIFVLAQLGLAYYVWKYRERGDGRKAIYSHGNNKLEATWTTAAAAKASGIQALRSGILILVIPPLLICAGILWRGIKARDLFNEPEPAVGEPDVERERAEMLAQTAPLPATWKVENRKSLNPLRDANFAFPFSLFGFLGWGFIHE